MCSSVSRNTEGVCCCVCVCVVADGYVTLPWCCRFPCTRSHFVPDLWWWAGDSRSDVQKQSDQWQISLPVNTLRHTVMLNDLPSFTPKHPHRSLCLSVCLSLSFCLSVCGCVTAVAMFPALCFKWFSSNQGDHVTLFLYEERFVLSWRNTDRDEKRRRRVWNYK